MVYAQNRLLWGLLPLLPNLQLFSGNKILLNITISSASLTRRITYNWTRVTWFPVFETTEFLWNTDKSFFRDNNITVICFIPISTKRSKNGFVGEVDSGMRIINPDFISRLRIKWRQGRRKSFLQKDTHSNVAVRVWWRGVKWHSYDVVNHLLINRQLLYCNWLAFSSPRLHSWYT